MQQNFADRLESAIRRAGSPAVVGIDPVVERLPAELSGSIDTATQAAAALEQFSRAAIDAAAGSVPAVKINSAFFEVYRHHGVAAFYRSIAHAHARGLLVIADVKRGDIGSTNALYARGHLADPLRDATPSETPDAVTLAGYMGRGAIQAFIDVARETGRGMYVLVRPSDPSADEVHEFGGGRRLYEHLAELVSTWGAAPGLIGSSGLSCVGAVVAPKDERSTRALRHALPHTPFLVPGFGAQGATAESVSWCFRAAGDGAVVNASRSVIYAYEQPAWRERYGEDWRGAIRSACEDFAQQAARIARPS